MRALSSDLSYSIKYDVEHDLFHAQNVFNDEYIKPTFIEYVQKLERENVKLKKQLVGKEKRYASNLELIYMKGVLDGFNKANKWHYVKDKLPPEPEGKDREILPKTYVCAYRLNNAYDDFEVGDFMYLGSGIWIGENKEYPIYAWLASPVDIPEPPKEQEQ